MFPIFCLSVITRSFQPSVIHIAEDSILGNQLLVAAGLADLPPVKDEDLVAVFKGGQPVRNREDGDPLLLEPLDLLLDRSLAGVVQRGGRLVEDQQLRRAQKDPGNRHPLTLPA